MRDVNTHSLQPHGLQHTRLPWPSLSPGVCPGSCPLVKHFNIRQMGGANKVMPSLCAFPEVNWWHYCVILYFQMWKSRHRDVTGCGSHSLVPGLREGGLPTLRGTPVPAHGQVLPLQDWPHSMPVWGSARWCEVCIPWQGFRKWPLPHSFGSPGTYPSSTHTSTAPHSEPTPHCYHGPYCWAKVAPSSATFHQGKISLASVWFSASEKVPPSATASNSPKSLLPSASPPAWPLLWSSLTMGFPNTHPPPAGSPSPSSSFQKMK